jgi:hypothetical protein
MRKSQNFFRYLWRVNAVLILLAAGAITFGVGALLVGEFGARAARNREAEAGIPVVAADSNAHLSLGRASVVAGTDVMRADLSLNRGGAGFSSGGYTETRNILFIEPGQKVARWLLPDNDHVIADSSDIIDDTDRNAKRMIATAVLVKSTMASPETAAGRLLLFDPPGRKIVEVASNVREIHLASLSGGELTILYERNRRFVLAAFDPGSLAKRREQEIDVPQTQVGNAH